MYDQTLFRSTDVLDFPAFLKMLYPIFQGVMRLLLDMYLICMRPEQFHICHSINVLLQCIFSTKLLIIRYTHSSLISSSSQSSQKTKIYCLCKVALRAETCRYFQRLLTTLKNPKVMKFLNLCLGTTIFKGYLNSLTKAPGATKNIQCLPREHLQLWPHLKDTADQAYGLTPERLWSFPLLLANKRLLSSQKNAHNAFWCA